MGMTPLQTIMDLHGKAAIVTGGAKGIGYGIACRLAAAGASVLIADIDDAAAKQAADEIQASGGAASPLKTDVSIEDDIKHMVESCVSEFGKLDILVNNAGIYPPAPLAAMTEDQFERVTHINLRSVFLATKYAADVMKRAGRGGRIINITSIDAIHPSMVGLAHYDASKHGVWGFTMNVALELAPHKIWVNAVAPGGISTPGTQALQSAAPAQSEQAKTFLDTIPMHRMGEPDDIGKVVLFLATDLASYMTGTQVVVDGGALLG